MKPEIDEKSVLRMLGAQTDADGLPLRPAVSAAASLVRASVAPAYIFRVFSITRVEGRCVFEDCPLALKDADVVHHLRGCHKAALMAVTLGMEADRLLRQWEADRLSETVVINACLDDAIERAANAVSEQLLLLAARENAGITGRFSPGYGNFSLKHQRTLLSVLDAQRRLGLYLNDGDLIIPQKSITAVVGIRKKEVK